MPKYHFDIDEALVEYRRQQKQKSAEDRARPDAVPAFIDMHDRAGELFFEGFLRWLMECINADCSAGYIMEIAAKQAAAIIHSVAMNAQAERGDPEPIDTIYNLFIADLQERIAVEESGDQERVTFLPAAQSGEA